MSRRSLSPRGARSPPRWQGGHRDVSGWVSPPARLVVRDHTGALWPAVGVLSGACAGVSPLLFTLAVLAGLLPPEQACCQGPHGGAPASRGCVVRGLRVGIPSFHFSLPVLAGLPPPFVGLLSGTTRGALRPAVGVLSGACVGGPSPLRLRRRAFVRHRGGCGHQCTAVGAGVGGGARAALLPYAGLLSGTTRGHAGLPRVCCQWPTQGPPSPDKNGRSHPAVVGGRGEREIECPSPSLS